MFISLIVASTIATQQPSTTTNEYSDLSEYNEMVDSTYGGDNYTVECEAGYEPDNNNMCVKKPTVTFEYPELCNEGFVWFEGKCRIFDEYMWLNNQPNN